MPGVFGAPLGAGLSRHPSPGPRKLQPISPAALRPQTMLAPLRGPPSTSFTTAAGTSGLAGASYVGSDRSLAEASRRGFGSPATLLRGSQQTARQPIPMAGQSPGQSHEAQQQQQLAAPLKFTAEALPSARQSLGLRPQLQGSASAANSSSISVGGPSLAAGGARPPSRNVSDMLDAEINSVLQGGVAAILAKHGIKAPAKEAIGS